MYRVNRQEQMCYLVGINNIKDGTIFHIVKENFMIDLVPVQPFPTEASAQAPAAMPGNAVISDHLSDRNVTANIEGGLLRTATREEIKQLCQQGITVDNGNKPVPENPQLPQQGEVPPPSTWEKPQYCICHANAKFTDQAGRFVNHRWEQIADYNKLQLFCMCLLEKWGCQIAYPTDKQDSG